MFRSSFRAPQTSFLNGAKAAFFMGQFMTRRHCARAHTPFVGGFLNTKMFINGDCSIRSEISALQAGCSISVYEMSQLTALCSGGAASELASLFAEFGAFPLEARTSMTHYSLIATFGRVVVNFSCILLKSIKGYLM